MFTQKQIDLIANEIGTIQPMKSVAETGIVYNTRNIIAIKLAIMFLKDNPKFDSNPFFEKCKCTRNVKLQ